MDGFPVTPGYTINIVKDREQSAVILLNSSSAPFKGGSKTYFITVPDVNIKHDTSIKHDASITSDNSIASGLSITPDNSIAAGVSITPDHSTPVPEVCHEVVTSGEEVEYYLEEEVVTSEDVTLVGSDSTDSDMKSGEDFIVHYEEVKGVDPSFFTEVAHEEVVEEEVMETALVTKPEKEVLTSIATKFSVQCDLCNQTLSSGDLAKCHMRQVHNILTYDGPFFKCDFCGLFVTDRVSHMKVAHYSPLSQAFCKSNNVYQCLQCIYSSDQLTNIRNHVDAKHRSGDNKYLCEECNSEYKTLNSMRAHKSRVHVKKRRKLEEEQQDKRRSTVKESRLLQEIQELEEKTLEHFSKTRGWPQS